MTEEEFQKLDATERLWLEVFGRHCDNCRYTYWRNENVETCLLGMKAGNLCEYKMFELADCPAWKKDPVDEESLERMVRQKKYTYLGVTDENTLCEMLRSKIHLDMKLMEDMND